MYNSVRCEAASWRTVRDVRRSCTHLSSHSWRHTLTRDPTAHPWPYVGVPQYSGLGAPRREPLQARSASDHVCYSLFLALLSLRPPALSRPKSRTDLPSSICSPLAPRFAIVVASARLLDAITVNLKRLSGLVLQHPAPLAKQHRTHAQQQPSPPCAKCGVPGHHHSLELPPHWTLLCTSSIRATRQLLTYIPDSVMLARINEATAIGREWCQFLLRTLGDSCNCMLMATTTGSNLAPTISFIAWRRKSRHTHFSISQ